MVLQTVIEGCLAGLGYELVDLEHGPGGLLRVYIDFQADSVPAAQDATAVAAEVGTPEVEAPTIRIEDCERVSHQLTHLLTVEQIEYSRLEVSSPGLDRPLRKPADFQRFAGWQVAVRLKRPFEGRRNFEGLLSCESDGKYGVEFADTPADAAAGPGRRKSQGAVPGKSARSAGGKTAGKPAGKAALPVATHKMVFGLDEIDKARLVPVVSFQR